MDDTHAIKERKPESRWGVVGSGGSNGDWLSIQDLQETPTTTTSVHLTPTSYNLGTPPPPSPPPQKESASGSSVRLYQYVRVCERVFETLAIFLIEIRRDKRHRRVCHERKWVKTPPSS